MSLLPTIPDSPPAKNEMSAEIREALVNSDKWEFDILNLEKASDNRLVQETYVAVFSVRLGTSSFTARHEV
jgi:hypothetical protein